eukprot:3066705-Rhodomonas_salina.1
MGGQARGEEEVRRTGVNGAAVAQGKASVAASMMEHFAAPAEGAGVDAHENSSTAASDTTIPDQALLEGAEAETRNRNAATANPHILSWLPSAVDCMDPMGQPGEPSYHANAKARP